MKISYTTLACPEWSWEQIVRQTKEMGYDGIEVRGVQRELYLPKAEPFLPDRIDSTKRELELNGLLIPCLGTSCSFHDPETFDKAIQEGKETINLAQSLGAQHIRVFGDKIPDPYNAETVIAAVASGLEQLGQYAEGRNVTVLLELHGDFSTSELLLEVLSRTKSKAIGILWDVEHSYSHGESPLYTFEKLGPWIKHCHIKDSKLTGGQWVPCLVGNGDIPKEEMIEILQRNGYEGWISLEFEKRWVPALDEPEVSLPAFKKYIDNLLNS